MMTFIRTWLNFPIESLPIAAVQSVLGGVGMWYMGRACGMCAWGRRGAPRAQPGTGSGRQWSNGNRVTRRVYQSEVYLRLRCLLQSRRDALDPL